MLLPFMACTPQKMTDSGALENNASELSMSARELVLIPERPQDIALHPSGSLYISAQAGSKLYRATPSAEAEEVDREEIIGDFNDLLAIDFMGETLFFTTSDFGITGALCRQISDEISIDTEVLATQSSDGTLLRWPVDLKVVGEQIWIADYEAGALFLWSNDQLEVYSSGQPHPTSLAWHNNELYIGGEDGIWKRGSSGIPQKVSDRTTLTLYSYGEKLWGADSDELFNLSGGSFPLEQLGRAGSLSIDNNVIFVADTLGEWVWRLDTEDEEPL